MLGDEVRDWLKNPVTVEFFNRVNILIELEDRATHKCLEEGELVEAQMSNAALSVYEEVKELPLGMIEDIKEGGIE